MEATATEVIEPARAATGEGAEGGRARKPRVAREPVPAGSPKVKSSVYLSEEAYERLSVHALMKRVDKCVLVERLITEHLREYVVSRRGPRVGEGVAKEPPMVPTIPMATPDAPATPAVEPPAPDAGGGEGKAPPVRDAGKAMEKVRRRTG